MVQLVTSQFAWHHQEKNKGRSGWDFLREGGEGMISSGRDWISLEPVGLVTLSYTSYNIHIKDRQGQLLGMAYSGIIAGTIQTT